MAESKSVAAKPEVSPTVANPFTDSSGKSLADTGQRVNGGQGGRGMAINPATTLGIPVMSPSHWASLDIIIPG
jgi:hypothetical protein